ncbi:hypothetical protein AB7Z54_04685 [Providencia manganoxydans]|uniref:hypothetical protein n=1 Tax=Providencia manganoxydans TaxID=2923283 RepID=UPI0034E4DD8C
MNIENKSLEEICTNLTRYFSYYFDWNDVDVTFFHVNLANKEIHHISNNYEWLLTCWEDDLDLHLSERLSPGFQYWSNYSEIYEKTLAKTEKRNVKLDICNKYGNIFEIISINSKKLLSLENTLEIYQTRPIIADYARNIWFKRENIILPVRAEIPSSYKAIKEIKNNPKDLLDTYHHMRFGNIRFTRKEMVTIGLFLSHCKIKEISAIQGCSDASEVKRIQNIKDKLGCSNASSSGLFKALKNHGITQACLGILVNYP